VRELVLPDGTRLAVRPLERSDRAALQEAVSRLSATTRYLRFAAPKPRLTKADLDHLLDIDHHGHEALLAVDPATGEGIAVARYVLVSGESGVAEIAVTVTDAWQGRGVGGALTALLIGRARAEGLVRLRAVTLAENNRAQLMLRRGGFRARGRSGGLVDYELALDP
jgi:RimJ/RimL family protein N-acetyltransferase